MCKELQRRIKDVWQKISTNIIQKYALKLYKLYNKEYIYRNWKDSKTALEVFFDY